MFTVTCKECGNKNKIKKIDGNLVCGCGRTMIASDLRILCNKNKRCVVCGERSSILFKKHHFCLHHYAEQYYKQGDGVADFQFV